MIYFSKDLFITQSKNFQNLQLFSPLNFFPPSIFLHMIANIFIFLATFTLVLFIVARKYQSQLVERIKLIKNKYIREDMKMVFIVNMDLKMAQGKKISQCMHAYDGIINKVNLNQVYFDKYNAWKFTGCAKICLKASYEEIKTILSELKSSSNVNYYLVRDAGRTQVAPNSATVLAIGPDKIETIDAYSGHLRLM